MSKPCNDCGKTVPRLRKGRCDACYMRVYRRGGVPVGASCVSCGETRRHVLVATSAGNAPCVLCGNCEVVKARARVSNLAELRSLVDPVFRAAGPPTLRSPAMTSAPVPVFDPTTD